MSPIPKTSKKPKRFSNSLEYVVLGLLVVGAFLLRTLGQLDKVFVGGNVWYRGVDAWYHMRLADLQGWLNWDMYAQYPNGAEVGYGPLLPTLARVLGETGAAYLPAVLGALTLIPVYLIGKELFSGKVGLLAVLLVAIIPGEFFHCTLLGFTDHHALEVFLMTSSLLFLLYTYRTQRYVWAVLAGISFGLYQLAWAGVAFFFLIVGLWVWWEFLRLLRNNESMLPLVKTVSIPAGIGLLISFAAVSIPTAAASIGLVLAPIALWLMTSVLKDRDKILFALTVAVPIAIVVIGYFIDWRELLVPIFWSGNTYIYEALPLNLPDILATYGISAFMAIAGLWFYLKRKDLSPLFVVWSILLIIAAVGQRRWGYYAIVPVSLLTAFFTFQIGKWVKPETRIAIIIVVAFFLIFPNIQGTIRIAQLPNNISADWYVTLTWMRENTPKPFKDVEVGGPLYTWPEEAYYSGTLEKPQYGILTWWDYGHWIVRIAHRVPTESPTHGGFAGSNFYTARTEEEANKVIKGRNLPYVLVDESIVKGKWPAVLARAKEPEFVDVRETFLWTLWTDNATTWTKIYERGSVKLFERTSQ